MPGNESRFSDTGSTATTHTPKTQNSTFMKKSCLLLQIKYRNIARILQKSVQQWEHCRLQHLKQYHTTTTPQKKSTHHIPRIPNRTKKLTLGKAPWINNVTTDALKVLNPENQNTLYIHCMKCFNDPSHYMKDWHICNLRILPKKEITTNQQIGRELTFLAPALK